jgi:hypothetical protein
VFTQTTVSVPQACLAASSDWNWLAPPVGAAPVWLAPVWLAPVWLAPVWGGRSVVRWAVVVRRGLPERRRVRLLARGRG